MTDEITKAYQELGAIIDAGTFRMGKTVWTNGEPEVERWKTIETAPKEEDAEYLVWDGKTIWLVKYGNSWGMEPKHNGCGCCVSSVTATHWMKLPEPPK